MIFLVVGVFALTLTITIIVVSSVLSLSSTYFSSGLGDLTTLVIYLMASGAISIYGYIELGDVVSSIENGRFEGIREALLLWGFLGLIFGFIVPGVIIFLTLVKYYTTFIRVITAI